MKDNEDKSQSVPPFTSYKYFGFDSPSFLRKHSPENSSTIVDGRNRHFGKDSSRSKVSLWLHVNENKHGAKFKSNDICECSDHDAQMLFKQGEKFSKRFW